MLAFARRDFHQALRLLRVSSVGDIFYELGSRALLLKVFYELQEHTAFYNHLDAFYNFVRRNKVMSEAQKQSHKRFISLLRQLMRVRTERNKVLGWKLRQDIVQQGVLDSTWFHRKLDELRIPRLQDSSKGSNGT